MISVTELTAYLYCPRKLYFEKILGIKELPKEEGIKGKIKHAVFEALGRYEKDILSSHAHTETLEAFEMRYRHVYYRVLLHHIHQAKNDLEVQGLKLLDIYRELWPFFLAEAKGRSLMFYTLAREKHLYNEALWHAAPKGIPELKIVSKNLQLVGVVDRVDIERGFIPIEIKTGRAPSEGVWKEHMIQVGAYMMLLSEHYGKTITEGYVDYRTIDEQRKVVMNPFLKDEILELLQTVHDLYEQKYLPQKITDTKKCEKCGIRKECFSRP